MHLIRSAIVGILALFAVASASAQQFPVVPDHTVIGRIGVTGQSGPSQAIPFANLLPQIAGTRSANTVFAGPASGAAAGPSFRALVSADLPNPIFGGSAVGSSLTLQSTSNGAASGDVISLLGSTVTIGNPLLAAGIINLAGPLGGGVTINIGGSNNGVGALNVFNASGGKQVWVAGPGTGTTPGTLQFPAVTSDQLVARNTTDTLTNKTFVCANQTSCVVRIATDVSGLGTGIGAALGVNVGSAGAPVLFNGALGSPSSAGTLPAHTLGGTISGGGNQINNVIIGAVTPLAGSFTTITSNNSNGLSVTAANPRVTMTDTGTSFAFTDIVGGGKTGLRFGQEGTGGGNGLIIGSAAGDGVVNMKDNNKLIFGANNTATLYLYPSGALALAATPSDQGVNNLYVQGGFASGIPITSTSTTRTIGAAEGSSIFNSASTITATLPAAASFPGRWWHAKTISTGAVNSASSNIVPRAGGAAGTAIIAAGTAGLWAILQSDGTNWVIMASN
jgi:hypothetical protein